MLATEEGLGQKKNLAYFTATRIFQERNNSAFIDRHLEVHSHEHFGQAAILRHEFGIG